MAYWCDDQALNLEQRRLDAQQQRALARIEAGTGETRKAGLDHEVTKAGSAPNPLVGEQGAS